MLLNLGRGTARLSLKYDGAPAIFVGHDKDGQFFVGRKGVFNKKPIRPKSHEDIKRHMPEGLHKTMCHIFDVLKPYEHKFQGIWQGDFLFSKDTLVVADRYVAFHPNIIEYRVDRTSPIAAMIERAELGIAWHTHYDDNGNISWTRPFMPVIAAVWTPETRLETHTLIKPVERFDCMMAEFTPVFTAFMTQYMNHTFRETAPMALQEFATSKGSKVLEGFDEKFLKMLLDLHSYLVTSKKMILERIVPSCIKTFLVKSGEHIEIQHEGMVLTDPNEKAIAKLVDRERFSHANFNAKGLFKRGWVV